MATPAFLLLYVHAVQSEIRKQYIYLGSSKLTEKLN